MKNTVSYEWDIETMDREDIVDHNHSDKLDYRTDDLAEALKLGTLVLVRTVGNDDDGVTDRTWAYVKGEMLPAYFADAYDRPQTIVPAKYRRELANALDKVHAFKVGAK